MEKRNTHTKQWGTKPKHPADKTQPATRATSSTRTSDALYLAPVTSKPNQHNTQQLLQQWRNCLGEKLHLKWEACLERSGRWCGSPTGEITGLHCAKRMASILAPLHIHWYMYVSTYRNPLSDIHCYDTVWSRARLLFGWPRFTHNSPPPHTPPSILGTHRRRRPVCSAEAFPLFSSKRPGMNSGPRRTFPVWWESGLPTFLPPCCWR